jgi:hypothetical protein
MRSVRTICFFTYGLSSFVQFLIVVLHFVLEYERSSRMKKSFSNFPAPGKTPALKKTPPPFVNGAIPIPHPAGGADPLSLKTKHFLSNTVPVSPEPLGAF